MPTPWLQPGQTVLFQGDSITDAGRSRQDDSELGHGYAAMVAAWFSMLHPRDDVRFINRGVSGNRVRDLQQRWQADCLELSPDWVSILVGINDTWRRYDSNSPTSTKAFADAYRELLRQTKEHTEADIMLMEPFVLPYPDDRTSWRIDLDPKISAVRELAAEFAVLYIPLDGLFAAASIRREPAFWAADGVHPTQAGHALIARAWLQAVEVM